MLKFKSLGFQFALAGIMAFAVGVTGCSSSDGGAAGSGGTAGTAGTGGAGGSGGGAGAGGEGGSGGIPVGAVTADPEGGTFATSVEIELSTDEAGATIYYTTDLSPVLDEEGNVQGTEYDGPFTVSATAVVKFLAGVDAGAGGAGGGDGQAFSSEQSEGYVITTNPIEEEWAESGHGDITAEAWRHWDGDGEVPSRCAKCHSSQSNPGVGNSLGFLEFATTGGNALAAPLPLGLECAACHERFPTIYSDLETYGALEPVEFPSGAELSNWSPSNICMSCHQGRESGQSVQDRIDADDGVGPYTFVNIHYYPAAASMYGSEANGGYQYEGKDYRPRNTFPSHPADATNCVGCHMERAENGEKHTWAPALDSCTGCHNEGDSFETLLGSPVQSYDNIDELIVDLYAQIQDYAENVIGEPIMYDSHAYPYWFKDNGMGANYGNRYVDFDAALLSAAYNYQVGQKDPAGYIHNGTYIQQILFDSIEDLGGSTDVMVAGRGGFAFNGADIGDASQAQQWQISGHGAADEEPFRHWDEDGGEVSASCAKCHTTAGFEQFANDVAITSHLATNAVDCWSCHASKNLFGGADTRYPSATLEPVEFPSGALLSLGNDSNLCMGCHSGRSSGLDVRTADPNDVVQMPDYPSFDFINIHYYAAAAVLFGADADGGYQYRADPDDPDTEFVYQGQNNFVGFHTTNVPGQGDIDLTDCVGCHMNSNPDNAPAKHTFMPAEVDDCSACHSGGPTFKDLQTRPRAYWFAIDTLTTQLYAAIQAYADGGGLPITSPVFYDSHAYPYWFKDNGMGANYGNRYRDFDKTMFAAAYNYQVAQKDPGGYIHNGIYMQQILWDSIITLGVCPNLNPPPPGRDPCEP